MSEPTPPVRVAHVLWRLGRGGGVQTVVRQVARGVPRERVAIEVVLARPTVDDDHVGDLAVPVHSLGIGFDSRLGPISRARTALGAMRVLRRLRPDVVHLHSGIAWMAIPWSLLTRTPVLLEVHDAPGSGRHGPWTDRVEGLWARLRGVLVVCHSTSVAHEVERRWRLAPDRIVRFPLAVELAAPPSGVVERWRRANGLSADDLVLVVVGRMVPSKRFELAVEVLARLQDAGPAAVLLVVGDGLARPDLEDLAASRGVGDRVRFLGPRFGPDLAEVLAAADVLCSTSAYEGFGLTLIEAMAMGTPPVAMAVGGVTDVVDDGITGVLVPDGSVPAMTDAVLALWRDPARRDEMARAGVERASGEFGVDRMVGRFSDLYLRLGGRGR